MANDITVLFSKPLVEGGVAGILRELEDSISCVVDVFSDKRYRLKNKQKLIFNYNLFGTISKYLKGHEGITTIDFDCLRESLHNNSSEEVGENIKVEGLFYGITLKASSPKGTHLLDEEIKLIKDLSDYFIGKGLQPNKE